MSHSKLIITLSSFQKDVEDSTRVAKAFPSVVQISTGFAHDVKAMDGGQHNNGNARNSTMPSNSMGAKPQGESALQDRAACFTKTKFSSPHASICIFLAEMYCFF